MTDATTLVKDQATRLLPPAPSRPRQSVRVGLCGGAEVLLFRRRHPRGLSPARQHGELHHQREHLSRLRPDRHSQPLRAERPEAGTVPPGLRTRERGRSWSTATTAAVPPACTFSHTRDHDVAHSLYLRDPDGNMVEIYADVMREWWTNRHGTIIKKKPDYIPGISSPPTSERNYPVNPGDQGGAGRDLPFPARDARRVW